MFVTHGSMAFELIRMYGSNFLVDYINMSWKVHLQVKCATCWTIFSNVTKFDNFVMGVVTTIDSIDL
jgi:hypothetical protein